MVAPQRREHRRHGVGARPAPSSSIDPLGPLAELVALLPYGELQQRLHQLRRPRRVAERPTARCSAARRLSHSASQHPALRSSRRPSTLAVALGEPPAKWARCRSRRTAELAPFVEAFLAVLAQGLQQPVAGVGAAPVGDDHGLVDQAAQQVADLVRSTRSSEHTASTAATSKPPANTANRSNSSRSSSVEQPVRPLHRRPQRLVPLQPAPAAAAQQPEAVVEPVGQVGEGHRPDPGGGQLDRQGEAVEPFADPGDDRHVGVAAA